MINQWEDQFFHVCWESWENTTLLEKLTGRGIFQTNGVKFEGSHEIPQGSVFTFILVQYLHPGQLV